MIKKLNIFAVLLLFCFAACEDMESAIRNSATAPTVCGDNLFWNGYKVGKIRDLDGDELSLARLGLLHSFVLIEPREDRILNRTRISGFAVADSSGKDVIWVVEMSYVAGEEYLRVSKFFLYNPQSDKATDVSLHVNSLRFGEKGNRLSETLLPLIKGNMPPDFAPFKAAETDGLDYRNNFEIRSKLTYESIEGKSKNFTLFNVTSGLELHSAFFIRDTVTTDKADTVLRISVKPIKVAYFHANAAFPLFFFDSDFKYDMFSGGRTYTGKDASVDKSKKSYLFSLSGGFFGCESRLTLEQWDFGKADYYTSASVGTQTKDVYQYTIPFALIKRQFDFKYHLGWSNFKHYGGQDREDRVWDFYAGYRYISFNKPAIVYTTEDVKDQDGKIIGTKLTGETLPQQIKMNNSLFGIGADNFAREIHSGFSFPLSAELYAGVTHTKFYAVESRSKMPQRVNMKAGCVAPCCSGGIQYALINSVCTVTVAANYRADMYWVFLDKKYSTGYDDYVFQQFSVSGTVVF